MPTDDELLRAWRSGDRKAGQLLFTRYFDVLRRFFANKVDDAEDLIQTTFMACIASEAHFEGRSSFRSYLLGIARNVLLKHWRTQLGRGTNVDIEELSLADLGAGPSSLLTKVQSLRRLLTALRMLPLRTQIMLELYYWEGMSGPDLAATLGISEAAARSRLHRAKDDLAAVLRRLQDADEAVEPADMFDTWATQVRACLASASENPKPR